MLTLIVRKKGVSNHSLLLCQTHDLTADYLCEVKGVINILVELFPLLITPPVFRGIKGMKPIGQFIQPEGEVFEDLFEHVLLFPFFRQGDYTKDLNFSQANSSFIFKKYLRTPV